MNTQTQLNFYNTIEYKGKDLADAMATVNNQAIRIIKIFLNVQQPLTPFKAHRIYCKFYPDVPITSIRRAITDLTKIGILKRTGKMKDEKYGRPNHEWVINIT